MAGESDVKTYWKNVYEKCKSDNDFETIVCMQKKLNEFIDAVYGVKREDPCEWVRRNNIYMFMEIGEVIAELKIKHWKRESIEKEKLVEEIADVLHFLVSMFIDAGVEGEFSPAGFGEGACIDPLVAAQKFVELAVVGYSFAEKACEGSREELTVLASRAVEKFFEALSFTGVSWEEVYEKYLVKNRVNFERHWHEE